MLNTVPPTYEFNRRPCMDDISRAAAERFRPQQKKYFYLFGFDNRDEGSKDSVKSWAPPRLSLALILVSL